MSKGNTWENDVQKLLYNATAVANIADNAVTSPITTIQYGLHTNDPGEAGDQTTNEIGYTGYARIGVARSAVGHPITGGSVSPGADVIFGAMTAGAGGTVTHFATGQASSAAGKLFHSGAVAPTVVVANGVTPRLTTATTIVED